MKEDILKKLNQEGPRHSKDLKASFENLRDDCSPETSDDFAVLKNFLEALENGTVTNELFESFIAIKNANKCYRVVDREIRRIVQNV